jgi:DNA topoisomerase-1
MPKNLVIVESPAKAKTISKFLGKDFQVESSFGHIRDLPKSGMSVDTENNFEPKYIVPRDKSKVVNGLKKAAKSADMIWLASDEDREGEAIAWHLAQALELKPEQTKRIVFHEITKEAITAAVENPRTVDENLVNAQQARRILDRLVGYELSPVLWRKVRKGLSAGRVQSVAVRLIVEKEREIEAFEGSSAYKVSVVVSADGKEFTAELANKLESQDDAEKFLNDLLGSKLNIKSVVTKPASRNPTAPFTTSTLQQEASSRLGYSVKRTMSVAQKLYEAGHITYMRTDSVTLSDLAHKGIKDAVTSNFGAEYYERRQYKTKSRGAQEAHEAIRPTRFDKRTAGDETQNRLYQLIWSRAVASQMAAAKLKRTTAEITISNRPELLIAKGEQIVFDGFLRLTGTKSVSTQILPDLVDGQELTLMSGEAKQNFTKPPARFTEASLVKKLEELGIGRPSTFAPTISTIQDRNYVEKGDGEGEAREVTVVTLTDSKVSTKVISENSGSTKGKLLPTDMGRLVSDFLVKHFEAVLDYSFTAKVEEQFDEIADGNAEWHSMLKDFYKDFHPLVEKAQDIDASETGSRRKIGDHPKSGLPVYARFGRFGPMIQVGDGDKENKPQFLPMPKGEKIETVSMESALAMEALPRTVGKTEDGQEIIANVGPYGPYVKVASKFISIGDEDPMIIDEALARRIIEENGKKTAPINEWGSIKVLRGRYGPYITDSKVNARIPKGVEPTDVDEKMAKELIETAKTRKKKPAAKKRK